MLGCCWLDNWKGIHQSSRL